MDLQMKTPEERHCACVDRLRVLHGTTLALVDGCIRLWQLTDVLNLSRTNLLRQAAAMRLLDPLLTSCVLNAWILLFDDDDDTLSLIRIKEILADPRDKAFRATVRSTRPTMPEVDFDRALVTLRDCARFLARFESRLTADRKAYAAHVVARQVYTGKVVPSELILVSKVVPKTVILYEVLKQVFGETPFPFENFWKVSTMEGAALFGLVDATPSWKDLLGMRHLPCKAFEAAVERSYTCQG